LNLLNELVDILKDVDTLLGYTQNEDGADTLNKTLKDKLYKAIGNFSYPMLTSYSCLSQDISSHVNEQSGYNVIGFADDFFGPSSDILLQSIDWKLGLRMPAQKKYCEIPQAIQS
jgi:hypothetical protein